MNNYDFINNINQSKFYELVKRGIISINIMTYKTIYESYIKELIKNKKSVAITFCADKYNVHENTIRNIIKFMES